LKVASPQLWRKSASGNWRAQGEVGHNQPERPHGNPARVDRPHFSMRHLICVCLFVTTAPLAACGSKPAPPPVPTPPGKRVDPATTGTITGHVAFEGTRPAVESIRMGTDQACVQAAGPAPTSDFVLISADGSLQNVFVYVKDDLSDYVFDVPTDPVILDQRGCRYAPHVFGVRVGQPVEIINSDATLHNVHALPMKNTDFNMSTPTKGSRMRRTFTVPEVMVRVKCDVHGWMSGWAGVMAHPFFAVTGANGAFSLKGLPPGTYTVEAWHEKYGTKSQQVKVDSGLAQTIAFTFTGK
jgi:plastocyanin